MIFIDSKTTDAYFNLAAEEFLLKNTDEEVCMIWQGRNAVIAGKHQNILAEINFRKAASHKVTIARRITGGGTVYHDMGNINFSLIRNGEPGNMINFEKNIAPVIDFLNSAGVYATRGPRNEIMSGGRKISGNAEHIHRNRLLHHGTLLFSSDLTVLDGILVRNGGDYADRAVKSARSTVANIKDLIPQEVTLERFAGDLRNHFLDYSKGRIYEFTPSELKTIRDLAGKKFSSWEWIFGWSPDYEFRNSFRLEAAEIIISLKTHRGIITSFRLKWGSNDYKDISEAFLNRPHSLQTVSEIARACATAGLIPPDRMDDFIFSFF
jgi:lipoate---protein ligase